jgi:hypothetical protein
MHSAIAASDYPLVRRKSGSQLRTGHRPGMSVSCILKVLGAGLRRDDELESPRYCFLPAENEDARQRLQ